MSPIYHDRGRKNTRPCAIRCRTLQWRKGALSMTIKLRFRRSTMLAALALLTAAALTVSGTSPAHADRCDDLAGQLKNQIDGISVGKTAANLTYLSHPRAKEMTLGCAGRTYATRVHARPCGKFYECLSRPFIVGRDRPRCRAIEGFDSQSICFCPVRVALTR